MGRAKRSTKRSTSGTTLTFKHEKDTKGTHRYQEDSEEPVIGTLYIRKDKMSRIAGELPGTLTVTIEAG